MSSDFAGGDPPDFDSSELGSVEFLLFDSLVHHLIEKGILTKNDALSIVQSAAEVVRGRMDDGDGATFQTQAALSTLERTYASFEAVVDRSGASRLDGHNIHDLRPPLHSDRPEFPSGD